MSQVPARWAIVPAAGIGSRFAATGLPKQYAHIGDHTVLEYSVAAMLAAGVAGVVVAVHPADTQALHLPLLQHPAVRFVTGGAERSDSVLQALLSLQGVAQPEDWVLVHDAARPCLLLQDVEKLLLALNADPVGGILAVPAIDTLKKVCCDTIEQTVDRSQVWQAQTPQMFRYGLLLQCLQAALAAGQPVTDEASAVEACGHAVKVVEGSRSNIKVTYPQDLALAAFFLQQEGRA
jgi:2-C-methyl-D-erythritol 4-phosphate cytidylyltransferase